MVVLLAHWTRLGTTVEIGHQWAIFGKWPTGEKTRDRLGQTQGRPGGA
jgi:hypothetical protein